MKQILSVFASLLLLNATLFAQTEKRKNYFPAWTFHQKNINVHGFSFGLTSVDFNDNIENTVTNGAKVEVFGGLLLLVFMMNMGGIIPDGDSTYNAYMQREPIDDWVNGFNLSPTGTLCNCNVNGFSGGTIASMNMKVNGVSFTPLNYVLDHNGLQLAISNQSYHMKGLQIGLFNKAVKLKGLQFGLWNKNRKRSLPFVNWNFKD